jgi:hypothetical protein
MSDFDNPWKDVLEHFFHHFLAFFFPEAHEAIDWARNYESLDKELQQIVSESELGLRLADKLFKVWLKDGREAWILIHIEIQNQRDPTLAERMFVYNGEDDAISQQHRAHCPRGRKSRGQDRGQSGRQSRGQS